MPRESDDFDGEDYGFEEAGEGDGPEDTGPGFEGFDEDDFDFEGEGEELFDPFNRRALRIAGRPDLDSAERSLWLDLWRSPVLDAIEEQGIETRFYGPLQATVAAALPEESFLNLLLGAAEPGGAEGGHLAEALAWIDSLDLSCRVPLDPKSPQAPVAEELLDRWGYRHTESQVRFLHDGSPPPGPPPGIGVNELKGFTEGFGDLLGEGYELSFPHGWIFDSLPGREGWRCYLAFESKGECPAAAAMLLGYEIVHLGFAATAEDARGLGCHTGLLRRMIADANEHHPRTILAETTEPLGERDGPSAGARNLLRAGFKQASVRELWRRG